MNLEQISAFGQPTGQFRQYDWRKITGSELNPGLVKTGEILFGKQKGRRQDYAGLRIENQNLELQHLFYPGLKNSLRLFIHW